MYMGMEPIAEHLLSTKRVQRVLLGPSKQSMGFDVP